MRWSSEKNSTILEALNNEKLTTIEIETTLEEKGQRCPDGLARTLNIMRRKGLIKGEVSQEKGGWVWWVEDK